MLEDANLISYQESKELFHKQTLLLKKFREEGDSKILLNVALLQMLVPICDATATLKIMKSNMNNDYDFLIIGAYISAENYDCCDNIFLSRLLILFPELSNYQKSIVKYLYGLNSYNKEQDTLDAILKCLDESITLCDNYVANYYLRYLILQDINDFYSAKNSVSKIVTDNDIKLLTIDDLIEPQNFIDEYILMKTMSLSTFESIFNSINMD